MKRRLLLNSVLIALCLLALWQVRDQRRDLVSLRAREQRLLARLAQPAEALAAPRADALAEQPPPALPGGSVPLELLRLRGQVTLLLQRRRDLAGVRAENEKLKAQLAARAASPAAAAGLPSGYIMRSQANWAGFSTPEATLQTFLWAADHRDLTTLLEAVIPDRARQYRQQLAKHGNSVPSFFNNFFHFPGARVVDRQVQPDGSVILDVQIDLRNPHPEEIRFRFINGGWKLDSL